MALNGYLIVTGYLAFSDDAQEIMPSAYKNGRGGTADEYVYTWVRLAIAQRHWVRYGGSLDHVSNPDSMYAVHQVLKRQAKAQNCHLYWYNRDENVRDLTLVDRVAAHFVHMLNARKKPLSVVAPPRRLVLPNI